MQSKVLRQLSGSLIGHHPKQMADKVDHVASLMASKAIVSFIHLHGWMLIRMKRAAGHTIGADLKPIENGSLPGRDSCLHISKDIQNTPRVS